jgi:hypothetical protein
MNEFWLMGAILSFIVFLIFMFLPSTVKIEIEMTFDPEGDYIENVVLKSIWAIRILSFLMVVGFLVLYFL